MNRKHLEDLIKFSETVNQADEIIRQYTGIEKAGEKKAFLKGMFDCIDDLKITGTDEECYNGYLNHILAVNSYEQEEIGVWQKFVVKVSYLETNVHGKMIFKVQLYIDDYFIGVGGVLYVGPEGSVRFDANNWICEKLAERIENVYTAERLKRLIKEI